MVGFLTGVKIGSAPYEARRINRTKLLLRKMIETQAEEFMDQCLAKDTENSI